MYEEFFELAERPFELTPNPRYLYLFPQHREALATLKYGISTARGLTLLLGEAGTGKTTLLRVALHDAAQSDLLCVALGNPTVTRSEFVHFLADEFGLSRAAAASKVVLLRELKALLEDRRARGATTVLLIDEAQSLPYELLEEVRLLANLETDTEKLLPVVLAGQPELADRLNEPSLRQLKQRVAIRCTVTPLHVNAAAAYVSARVRKAGGNASKIFTREAVQQIFDHSNGIPRTVNVICDNVLLAGFAREEKPVTARLVAEVCASLDLRRDGDSKGDVVGLAMPMPTTAPPEAEPAWGPVPPPAQNGEAGVFDAVARAWRSWRL
jgi:general secretion pathway protein A